LKALQALRSKLQFGLITPTDNTVGIRMSNRRLDPSGQFYIPGSAVINAQGPFPRADRRTQALMILHELGHLVLNNGTPLLQDDGPTVKNRDTVNQQNTELVEANCKAQLDAIPNK